MSAVNSWGAAKAARKAGHPGVFITFLPMGVYSGGWSVISVSEQTDPGRIHNGGKIIFSGRKADSAVLRQAMSWAEEKYGIKGWAKIPGFHGDYFPEQAVDAIRQAKEDRVTK